VPDHTVPDHTVPDHTVPDQVGRPRHEPGSPVRLRFTKWGGKRHHGAGLVYLGADEHGDWLGDRVGNQWSGGPKSFVSVSDNVLLVPRDRGMTAMFYTEHPEQAFELYVDITTTPVWDGDLATAVDLDLDHLHRARHAGAHHHVVHEAQHPREHKTHDPDLAQR